MVEVFKTNIPKVKLAKELTKLLHAHFPNCKINFDLQDCDKIMRIEGREIHVDKIIKVVLENGYVCEVLD